MTNDIFYANMALNELEIRQKKVRLESKVRVISANITSRCDMKCPFCIYRGRHAVNWEMPANICREIIRLFPYLQMCVWQGGEAYLHPRFKEIIREAARFPNIQHTLITNGSFLNEEWLGLFSKIPQFHIMISLESVRKETYEELRKGGSFERLKNNLDLINSSRAGNQHKLSVSLNIIIMKKNYLELEEMVDFAIEHQFGQIILTPLYANGLEFNEKEYLPPDNEESRRYFSGLMPELFDKAGRNGINLSDRFSGTAATEPAQDNQGGYKEPADEAICFNPWQQLFIEINGEVKNYCHCPFTIGDINSSSIEEIWNSQALIRQRQNILNHDYRLCSEMCLKGLLYKSNLKIASAP